MRVLLVNPRCPPSFWTLSGAAPLTQRSGLMTNLALATLAALTPPDVEVVLVDEQVQPLDPDLPCDLVGITGYITQRSRMIEVAEIFRRRGVPVVIGGPYASLSPASLRGHADALVIGEAEDTWPALLDDARAGRLQPEYRQERNVDMRSSPAPRVDRLAHDRYYMGAVQTSRGCPFECEFCDVIVYLGRRQRHKDPDQVVREVEAQHRLGHWQVFLCDDNLTAHRGRASGILEALAAWNAAQTSPVSFNTQLSIDVARPGDPMLELCASAGLAAAFVGIETPSEAALLEVRKHQNARQDLVANVRRLQEHGIMVQAGMIVGFDADGPEVFGRQYEFAQEAGTTMISLGPLNAPEGTPLEARLAAQGRLRPEGVSDVFAATNIVPLQMSTDDLMTGTRWLANRLYRPAAFLERTSVLARDLPPCGDRPPGGRDGAALWDRVVHGFAQLGPDLAPVPRTAAGMFRGKELSSLVTALIYYFHVVRVLRTWGAWDPELAERPEPVW